MNFKSSNKKLQQETTLFVKNNIKDVKYVDDIDSILTFRFSIIVDHDINKLYQKLYHFKKLLQLLLNGFNNIDAYKDLSYHLMVDEIGGCEKWQSCCEYDDNSRLWRCISRPSEEAMVDLLFNYLLYLTSVRKKEGYISPEIGDGVRVKQYRNVNNTNIPSSSNARLGTNEYQRNQCYRKEMKSQIMADKWICGRCEYFNEYNLTNCMACGELLSEGFWHCKHCMMKNSGNVKICDTCHKSNDNIRVKQERHGNDGFDDNKHKEKELFNKLRKEEWQCGNCGNVYSYIDNVCRRCNGDRNNCGVWRCDICTFRNEFVNHNCGACGTNNDQIDKKRYNNNNTNTWKKNDRSNINDGSGRWQCRNFICGSTNDKNEEFCSGCKLERNMSLIVGATIKKKTSTGIVEIWMCHKCNKQNHISSKICKGFNCKVKKGELITCISCGATSDERRSNCDKCDNKF